MSMTQEVSNLMDGTDGSTALHGEIVTWDTSQAGSVDADQIVVAVVEAGLDPSLVTDLSTRNAFTRACRDLRTNRVIDRLETDGDCIVFQFTSKHLAGGVYEHDFEAKLRLNVETKQVSCDTKPGLAEVAQLLLDKALVERTASDITRLVQKYFKANGDLFSINPHKGVAYFVPQKFASFTGQVETFLDRLGGKLWRFPVPVGTKGGDKSVKEAVEGGLQAMIDELVDTVDGWDVKTRGATMVKHAERFRLLKHKISCYSTFLKDRQERLEFVLEQASKQMCDKVQQIDAERNS